MIEAMACGMPVIATPCGAAAEVVRDGETGYIRGDLDELAATIGRTSEIARGVSAASARAVLGRGDGGRVRAPLRAVARGSRVTLTILEGSTFCVCDDVGELGTAMTGFFAEDTRYLSLLRLTINGARPLLLSSGRVEYFSAAIYMRNPLAGGLRQDAVTIMQSRFVGTRCATT